jgi:hypothetical protein
MPQNQLVALVVQMRDHLPGVVELLRVEFVGVVVGGPGAVDQDDGCGQAKLAVAVDVLVDLRLVAVVVARLPGRERPVWRKLLAPGESREAVEDQRESRPLKQHEAKLVGTDLDADAVAFGHIEVE